MGKRLSFPTLSFGSDGSLPDTGTLAAWLPGRRGTETDIVSFFIDRELTWQREAGVSVPCAGGNFYFGRWKKAVSCLAGDLAPGEEEPGLSDVSRDAREVSAIVPDAWLAVPAPHLIEVSDGIFGDQDEKTQTIFSFYRTLMRTGRDAFVRGHILIGQRPVPEELEALSGRRTFFYFPDLEPESVAVLLEYQGRIAVRPRLTPALEILADEYDIHQVILIDPEQNDLRKALEAWDPDQVRCGGYCTGSCREYWHDLVKNSGILK